METMKPVRESGRRGLGPPEEAILRGVGRYFYLSALQLTRLLYSPGSLTYVQTTLKTLAEAGFLQRLFLPRASQHGGSPAVYALASKGRRYLQALGVDVPARYRPSEEAAHVSSLLFLAHTLAVNDFVIAAELLSRRHPDVSLEGVVHERELRRRPVYVTQEDRKVPIVPDSWLDLRLGGDLQMCLVLEMDRGTVEQRAWRRKVRSLVAYAAGPYQEQFGTSSLTVAVVAEPGRKRLASLLAWTEAEITSDEEADLFRLTALSQETVSPEELFLSPVWYRPGDDEGQPLLEGVERLGKSGEAAAFP